MNELRTLICDHYSCWLCSLCTAADARVAKAVFLGKVMNGADIYCLFVAMYCCDALPRKCIDLRKYFIGSNCIYDGPDLLTF